MNILSPRRLSMSLFPPAPPSRHLCSRSATELGNDFERFVEHELAKRYPNCDIIPKATVTVSPGLAFECDMLVMTPARIPWRSEFSIVECKNYRSRLPYHFIAELALRRTMCRARRAILFTAGPLSSRSLRYAALMGVMVIRFNSDSHSFISLTHENPTPVPALYPRHYF